jgi:hypothetical protein
MPQKFDEPHERAIIEFLGKYNFEALPWRVPFEKEAEENIEAHEWLRKQYAPFLPASQIKQFEQMFPVDFFAFKRHKIYFFLLKTKMNFESEEEKKDFFATKKKGIRVYVMSNPYPKQLFKVYDLSEKDVTGLNIKPEKEVDLNKI